MELLIASPPISSCTISKIPPGGKVYLPAIAIASGRLGDRPWLDDPTDFRILPA